jgi:hypothetical protein
VRRIGWIGTGAAIAMVAVPLTLAAPSGGATHQARAAATAGLVYGGVTSKDDPVIVEFNRSKRRVVRIVIALTFSCTSGDALNYSSRFVGVKVSKKGRFSGSSSDTTRNADGSTTDYAVSMRGALNRARTKVTGRWTEKATYFDASAHVTDTCDTGSLAWTAKQ